MLPFQEKPSPVDTSASELVYNDPEVKMVAVGVELIPETLVPGVTALLSDVGVAGRKASADVDPDGGCTDADPWPPFAGSADEVTAANLVERGGTSSVFDVIDRSMDVDADDGVLLVREELVDDSLFVDFIAVCAAAWGQTSPIVSEISRSTLTVHRLWAQVVILPI
jgi:hypothetical protein